MDLLKRDGAITWALSAIILTVGCLFFATHSVTSCILLPAFTMANTLSPSDLKRYAKEMRKLSMQRVRKPWRRSSRPRVKRSAAEKSAARKRRKEFHTEYSAALAAARDIIWEQAIQLREKFGRHSVDYYYETIMQQSRKTVNKCSATRWNAFVRQEVKRANDGKSACSLLCMGSQVI
jgi:hypothetical protein